MTHQRNLFRHIRTRNRFSATSVDQLPHHLVSMWLYGHMLLMPIPDIDRTDYFLMLGANPIASNGSIWTVPDVRKRIKDLTGRGGKLVVIDPRRTETAELASEHHFIRPGTDAALLLALLHVIFRDKLTSLGALAEFTDGLEEVQTAVASLTLSGLPALQVLKLPTLKALREIWRQPMQLFATAEWASALKLTEHSVSGPYRSLM